MYRHIRRNEKRLVVLHPGPQVKCHLVHTSLGRTPEYETISYPWGDRNLRDTIFVNDEETDVPASTKAALQRMQTDQDRLIWIDAVCINQEDVEERSRQVALMAAIYSASTQNLVWLGHDDGWAHRAVASIQVILQEIDDTVGSRTELKEKLFHPGGHLKWKIAKIRSQIDERAILNWYSSPWFRRRWVVQEAALAKHAVCFRGTVSILLKDVLIAAAWIHHHYLTLARLHSVGLENAAKILPIVDEEFGDDMQHSMWSLLNSLGEFETDEPKDCIYAVLALYQKSHPWQPLPQEVTPDYSLSLAEVYGMVTAMCIIYEEEGLDVLGQVRHEQIDTLPSWIPHYNIPDARYAPRLLPRFRASQGMTGEDPVMNELRLTVSGYLIATVERMGTLIESSAFQDTQKMAEVLREATSIVQSVYTQPPDTILGITMCGARRFDASLANEADAAATYRTFEASVMRGEFPPWPADGDYDKNSPEGLQSEYLHELISVCRGLKVVATSEHFGLGPALVEKGDVLAILHDCRWPVFLRPFGDVYRYLGAGYVYGIMFGEAVIKAKAQNKEVERFVLV